MQHIHILGICGTFMGGIAAIAKQMGFRVTGCDTNVYPPMSTQLAQLGIELTQGFAPEQLDDAPDLVIIGNALSRGNVLVEYILERKIPYTSGPQWLLDHVLKDRWVVAIAGTHGKTTTSSMVAWILTYAGLNPGYLIGGVPQNLGNSAALGAAPFFVIEADEYDTAFFDKRSKFVHYRPNTLVLNNMEFDHADIFNDLADIQRQFHHLIRMVPGNGLLLAPKEDAAIAQTLAMGCWTPVEYSLAAGDELLSAAHGQAAWQAEKITPDGSEFIVRFNNELQGTVRWSLIGDFNIDNALMAIAAARHAGVPTAIAIDALADFINTKRRLELRDTIAGIRVYDDFAHHPTAIGKTLKALRTRVGNQRILAVLEPRSNTMKSGVHKHTLAASLAEADEVYLFQGEQVQWSVAELSAQLAQPCIAAHAIDSLVSQVVANARPDEHVLIMSNGGFNGFHDKLLVALRKKHQEA